MVSPENGNQSSLSSVDMSQLQQITESEPLARFEQAVSKRVQQRDGNVDKFFDNANMDQRTAEGQITAALQQFFKFREDSLENLKSAIRNKMDEFGQDKHLELENSHQKLKELRQVAKTSMEESKAEMMSMKAHKDRLEIMYNRQKTRGDEAIARCDVLQRICSELEEESKRKETERYNLEMILFKLCRKKPLTDEDRNIIKQVKNGDLMLQGLVKDEGEQAGPVFIAHLKRSSSEHVTPVKRSRVEIEDESQKLPAETEIYAMMKPTPEATETPHDSHVANVDSQQEFPESSPEPRVEKQPTGQLLRKRLGSPGVVNEFPERTALSQ
jgi:hypothetical protein